MPNFGDKKLVFFGNERLVSGLEHTDAPILSGLLEHGFHIVAVVSHASEQLSRKKRDLEVEAVAKAHAIPVFLPEKPSEIQDELRSLNADAAVLVAYGRIIPQSVIDIFPLGIINVHPSLLPKYRGPTPIESAILHGDDKTGVSIMQLTAGMDEGPVYVQEEIALSGRETKFELYKTCVEVSSRLLFEALPQILSRELTPVPQSGNPTYCNLLTKQDGLLEPLALSADKAERRVRAYLKFPKTKLTIMGQRIIVTKAHVTADTSSPLDIECADGNYLSIDELIGPSGKTMDTAAYLRGYYKNNRS